VISELRMPSLARRSWIIVFAFGIFAAGADAQAPPPEVNAYVLIDVGPIEVPAPCPCITSPFTVPTVRPGWGFGDGPAAPEENAKPTRAERQRQASHDAEDRKALPTNVEDGLAGNPAASMSVAMQLTTGTVVGRNDDEAARWFHLAAEQGHPDAFLQLGHRYHKGIGVPQNDQAAAYWFYQGASSGDRNAMVALGLLYAAGRGVPRDWHAAVRLWERARSGGRLPIASRFVGDAYACGLGVSPDPERAVLAYRESAAAGELSSSVQLGHMLVSGCAGSDDETAVKEYKRAADSGNPEAQVALSDLYRQGRGVEYSPYHAYMWARLAERRLRDGELRMLAKARADQAARLLSAFEIKDCEAFVESLIAAGRSR
jgi:TPR repeat protein